MKIHHVAVMVSDMDESLKFYRDVLGLNVVYDAVNPDGIFFKQDTADDITHGKNVKSRLVLLMSDEGSMVEINEFINPRRTISSKEQLGYFTTGFKELAFQIDDIDGWFEKVQKAGYETTTPYIWDAGEGIRSFLCFDRDYNMIQFITPTPQY